MSERNQRRAAARKARKLENKQSAHQGLTQAATAQGIAVINQTENPRPHLDPVPPPPVPTHFLDPFEESDVELTKHYASHRSDLTAKFAAHWPPRTPANQTKSQSPKPSSTPTEPTRNTAPEQPVPKVKPPPLATISATASPKPKAISSFSKTNRKKNTASRWPLFRTNGSPPPPPNTTWSNASPLNNGCAAAL